MTIRVEHQKNYTCITNSTIRDKHLSFKARGLHHLLLSYPDGWQVKIEHLVNESEQDGRTAVASALHELEKYGYLERKQRRDSSTGKLGEWESVIRECPTESRKPDCGVDLKQETRKQETRKRVNRNQVSDSIINTNTEQISKKEVSTLPLPPQGERESERNFGFEINQEPLPDSSASLLIQPEVTHEVTSTVVKTSVPPLARTDKFFTGKTRDQQKYDRWAETAHPALVYGGEDTPWLEPPTRAEFIRFNQSFIDWHTNRCMEKFHKQDSFQAEADFVASLRNTPESCASRWTEYHKHMVCHAVTAAARVNSGMEISETEKQKFIKHQRAFTKVTAESTENIDQKVLASAQQASHKPPQLESVATVPDDIWDTIAATTEEEQAQFSVPEGALDVAMYQRTAKPEDSDYFRRLYEKRQNNVEPIAQPVKSLEELEGRIDTFTSKMGMPRVSDDERQRMKDEERLGEKLAYWAKLLDTAIPQVIADVTRQANAQGYEIIDGQIREVDF